MKFYKNQVSIIIPTHNREEDLKKCLNSIEKQTVLPYEVIVIDDNSKDETKKVVDSFKLKNILNLKYSRNKVNKKQSFSKNKGAELAKGDILAFLDDDCIADKNWVSLIIRDFKELDILALGGKIFNLSKENSVLDNLVNLPKHLFLINKVKTGRILPTSQTTAKFNSDDKMMVDWVSAGNMAVRKKNFLEVGGFQEIGVKGHCAFEEPDFFLRFSLKFKCKILYDGKIICHHKFSLIGRDLSRYERLYYFYYNQAIFFLKNKMYKKEINKLAFTFYTFWQLFMAIAFLAVSPSYSAALIGKFKALKFFIFSN